MNPPGEPVPPHQAETSAEAGTEDAGGSRSEYVTTIDNRVTRWFLEHFWVPVLLTFLTEVVKLSAIHLGVADFKMHPLANLPFRFSFFPAFLFGLGISRHILLRKTPSVFHRLVANGVVTEETARELGERLTRRMNGFLPNVLALFFGIAIPAGIWMKQVDDGAHWLAVVDPAMILICYLITLIIWKGIQVGWFVGHLGSSGRFEVRPLHPDDSGGLGCVGELCFAQSLGFTAIAVFCAAWMFVSGEDILAYYQTVLLCGLFLAAALSLATFFIPLHSIHRAMVRQAKPINLRLEETARLVSRARERLILEGPDLIPEERAAVSEELRHLSAILDRERRSPTWPIPLATIIQYGTTAAPMGAAVVRYFPEIAKIISPN